MVNWPEVMTQTQTFKPNSIISNISIVITVNKFEEDLKNKQKNKTTKTKKTKIQDLKSC